MRGRVKVDGSRKGRDVESCGPHGLCKDSGFYSE